MNHFRFRLLTRAMLTCAFPFCLGFAVYAANVRLLNGDSCQGNVQFNNNQIVIVSQTGTTRIDLADVLDAAFRDDSPNGPVLPAGVLLTNGSLVAGNVNALTDPIKLNNLTIPLSSVAWVVFQPIPHDKISQPSSGQTGAILPTGEFFPGAIGGVTDDRVAVNSALFGPQRFSIRGRPEITALVLRDVQDSGARYEVYARNGSVYAENDLKIEGDFVVFSDPVFGNVRISKDDILELRLAKSQFQFVAGMKPDRVAAQAGIDTTNAVQVPQDAKGADTKNLQVNANVAVTYQVPKGLTSFSASAVTPKGLPSDIRFTFAVYGDRTLLTRTPAVGPGDNPQHVNVLVANVHTITLIIEPASVDASKASAQWIQPMFLRQ